MSVLYENQTIEFRGQTITIAFQANGLFITEKSKYNLFKEPILTDIPYSQIQKVHVEEKFSLFKNINDICSILFDVGFLIFALVFDNKLAILAIILLLISIFTFDIYIGELHIVYQDVFYSREYILRTNAVKHTRTIESMINDACMQFYTR